MAYDYEIQYKNIKLNDVVNALSRVSSSEMVIQALSTISTDFMSRIQAS